MGHVTQHKLLLFLAYLVNGLCHTTHILILPGLISECVLSHSIHSQSPLGKFECVMPHNTHFILYWFNWDYIMTHNTYSKFFHQCVLFYEGINVKKQPFFDILKDTHSHSLKCVILNSIHTHCILRHIWVCLVTKHKLSISPDSFLSQTCHTTQIIIRSASFVNASCHTTHSVILTFLNCECHTKQALILLILSCFFWNNILHIKHIIIISGR